MGGGANPQYYVCMKCYENESTVLKDLLKMKPKSPTNLKTHIESSKHRIMKEQHESQLSAATSGLAKSDNNKKRMTKHKQSLMSNFVPSIPKKSKTEAQQQKELKMECHLMLMRVINDLGFPDSTCKKPKLHKLLQYLIDNADKLKAIKNLVNMGRVRYNSMHNASLKAFLGNCSAQCSNS